MRIILGLDPGLHGALVAVNGHGELLEVADMPTMPRGKAGGFVKNELDPATLARALAEWHRARGWAADVVIAYLERVEGRPTVRRGPDGKAERIPQGAASIFSLGDSFGVARGVLVARGIPVRYVRPGDWKAAYRLGKGKEASRAAALRFYPQGPFTRKRDHNRAEAALLARYGASREEAQDEDTVPF